MIRTLVVEDSPTVRQLLVHTLQSDPDIAVVGIATNGQEAIDAVGRLCPDVVTMDVIMPGIDGLEATKRIMQTHPVPIVAVSSTYDEKQVETTFALLDAGALAAIPKPSGPDLDTAACKRLIRTVRLMSEVRVVRRSKYLDSVNCKPRRQASPRWKAVGIGASTGGPPVIAEILARFSHPPEYPVLVVQHMADGFMHGFARWLTDRSGLPTTIARHGQTTEPGHVYLGADGHHLGIDSSGTIVLDDSAIRYGMKPSVAHLFDSLRVAYGSHCAAVLLTGMGSDGAAELHALRTAGAMTIAQNEASSVVHGMPGRAIALGAACLTLEPAQIGGVLEEQSLKFGRGGIHVR